VQTGVYPGASCCFNNGFWLIDLAYQHVVDRCFFLFRWEMSKSSLRCFFGKHSEEIAASDFPLESEFWSRHFFRRISLSLSTIYTIIYLCLCSYVIIYLHFHTLCHIIIKYGNALPLTITLSYIYIHAMPTFGPTPATYFHKDQPATSPASLWDRGKSIRHLPYMIYMICTDELYYRYMCRRNILSLSICIYMYTLICDQHSLYM